MCRSITRIFDAPTPRFDVGQLLQRQHDGADHAPAERYPGDGDGDDHRAEPGAQGHRDRHRQDQIGKRLQELDDALADEVEPAAEEAARQAPERAEGRAEQHRPQRYGQGRAAAVDDPAEHIPADLVGAEDMALAWRLAHRAKIGFERIVRREHRRGDGHDNDQRRDAAPERRQGRAAGEIPQAATGAAPASGRDCLRGAASGFQRKRGIRVGDRHR
jgi:hypothetical protein